MRYLSIVLAVAALATFAAPSPAFADHPLTLDGIDLDGIITDEDLDVGEEMCAR